MEPTIRVAWHEGFAPAYQVVGDGAAGRDLLYLPGFESNVDMMWRIPAYRAFLERLASLARLITHDRRGLGCSDRLPPGVAPTLEGSREGMLAVLDAVGSERWTMERWAEEHRAWAAVTDLSGFLDERFLADHVADGTYVEVPGRDGLPWVGDAEPVLLAVERFLAEGASGPRK